MSCAAFPDHRYEVLDVIADAAHASFVVRLRARGTHRGDLFGIAPSGQHAEWTEARFIRVCVAEPGGRWPMLTTEHWAISDSLTMMLQLGHVPPPGARESW
jgi:predicted ester cyclase